MTYIVVSNLLWWTFDANSPEEAHAKAKSSAGRWMNTWKKEPDGARAETRKEIIRILRGNFVVKEEFNEHNGRATNRSGHS
jgi:hypothetical protein